MISICQYEEDVLENWNEELLEKDAGRRGICLCNIVDQLDAHIKPCSLHFAVVMLACPETGINDKLELSVVKFKQS